MHLAFVAACGLVAAASPAPDPRIVPGDHIYYLHVSDRERHYTVHVPKKLDSTRPWPVVVMLHGAGGGGAGAIHTDGWVAKADRERFLVVGPDGTPVFPDRPPDFFKNPRLWNDGSGRGAIGRLNVPDVRFLGALLDDLESRYPIDRRRIFVTGFSNGAGLTFRAGAEMSRRVAAIAPVASHLWVPDLKLERPVPMIYIVGTADPQEPLAGGPVKSPWGGKAEEKPPVENSIKKWASLCGCPPEPRTLVDKNGVKAVVYGPGKAGCEVVYYTIEGQGHHWPGGVSVLPKSLAGRETGKLKATDVIWDFFKAHPLPVETP